MTRYFQMGFDPLGDDFAEPTFDTFVDTVGEGYSPLAVARKVSAELGSWQTLVTFTGPPGSGKQHLLSAIQAEIGKQHPEAIVRALTTREFRKEFVEVFSSGRDGRTSKLRTFWESLQIPDVLIISNLEEIITYEYAKGTLVNLLDLRAKERKLTVFSLMQIPERRLCDFSGRLATRLRGGLTVETGYPKTRKQMRQILAVHASTQGIKAPDSLLDAISELPSGSPSDLFGVLIRAQAYADLAHKPLTLEVATEQIEAFTREQPGAVTTYSIREAVSAELGVPITDLLSKKRPADVAYAREICYYLSRKLTELSLPEIGRAFGRDHSTVVHGVAKIEGLLQTDTDTILLVRKLTAALDPSRN